jgi:hypothetical protein
MVNKNPFGMEINSKHMDVRHVFQKELEKGKNFKKEMPIHKIQNNYKDKMMGEYEISSNR